MAVFLITPLQSNFDQIGEALRKKLPPSDFFEIQSRGGYLVSFGGTTVELSQLLGITSPDKAVKSEIGSAMITSVGSYFGRGPTTMWEWLKTRFEDQ